MTGKADNYLERIQIMDQIAKMARMVGWENDDQLLLDVELGGSRLSYAQKALQRAHTRCVRETVAKQLNPPAPVDHVPPPAGAACVIVGEEVETGAPAWFLADEDICGGVVIIGVTGCGKTVTLAKIISCLPPSYFAYLPDSKREVFRIYTALNLPFLYVRPCDLPVCLLACPTDTPELYFTGLLEKWAPILPAKDETWPPCAASLAVASRFLKSVGPLTLNQGATVASGLVETSGKDKFGTFSAQMSMLAQVLGKNADFQSGPDILGKYQGLGLDFSGVSLKARYLIEIAITQQFLQGKLSSGLSKDACLVLIHDEGSDTFSRVVDQTTASRVQWQNDLLVKSRSLKVGKIILLQFISQGCDSLLSSMRVLIVMRLPDPTEARLAVRYLNLPEEFIPVIQNLPDGEAFFKTPMLLHGVHIKIPFTDLGPYPSDHDIAIRMARELKWLEDNSTYARRPEIIGTMDKDIAEIIARHISPPVKAEVPAVEPEQVVSAALLADWAEFLREVLANTTATSTQHGRNLKWGMYKTARVKKELLKAGLIAATKQNTAGRPAERLLVTRKGIVSLEALPANDKK